MIIGQDDDIGRVDVAMNDTALMGVSQRRTDLDQKIGGQLRRNGPQMRNHIFERIAP